jgi:hypothetical protein
VHNRTRAARAVRYNLYPGLRQEGHLRRAAEPGRAARSGPPHCSTVRVTPLRQRGRLHARGRLGRRQERDAREHPPPGRRHACCWARTPSTASSASSPSRNAAIRPVTDDMALCPPRSDEPGEAGKLTLMDAEDAWFVRVNHIDRSTAIDPHLERICAPSPKPAALPQHRRRPARPR